MLDIGVLTTRWGTIFGGINEYNVFRGTTILTRTDNINALYPDAAEQRIVVDDLYTRTQIINDSMQPIVQYFQTMAANTLVVMCADDLGTLPNTLSLTDCLNKLVEDMTTQSETFELPTVTIGGATSAAATPVTTLLGPPTGNGVIIGSVINPKTAVIRYNSYEELIRVICTSDVYGTGGQSGQESFDVTGGLDTPSRLNADWPRGSGSRTSVSSTSMPDSGLVRNAYFDNWTETNIPDNWTLFNLSAGTTIQRSTDKYSGEYAVQLTGAGSGAEIRQQVTGLQSNTNYVIGIRMKRPGTITGGVITIGLCDETGTIVQDAAGNNLSTTLALTGSAGDYALTYAVLPVPKSYATPVHVFVRVTTTMVGGESVLLDNFEFRPMTELYPDGPTVAAIPGSIGWAVGDTYTFSVANSAGVDTFVRNLDRIFNISDLDIPVPVSGTPTVLDSLIS
jgi:hypothetical protein